MSLDADQVEQQIERLTLISNEAEYYAEFRRDGAGWICTTDDQDEDGRATGEKVETPVSSLAAEVRDFVAAYFYVAEVSVAGPDAEAFVGWLRPLVREDQDSLILNGVSIDLFAE